MVYVELLRKGYSDAEALRISLGLLLPLLALMLSGLVIGAWAFVPVLLWLLLAPEHLCRRERARRLRESPQQPLLGLDA
jgi:hypothetical protein